MKYKKNSCRSTGGSVMVEAALVIPIILGITFFIIELGNAFYLLNSTNQVARAASRFASVTPVYTQQQLIDQSGANQLLPDVALLTLTAVPAPGVPKTVGTAITITATYAYTPVINPFNLFGSGQTWAPTIMSTAISRSEVGSAS